MAVLDLVQTDLCRPMRVPSIGRAKYIVQFVNDHSRWGQIYLLKGKSDMFHSRSTSTWSKTKLAENWNAFNLITGRNSWTLPSTTSWRSGIIRRLTVPHNPQQKGVTERRNRTILEMARCILLESSLPPRFWGEAVNTANYVRNRYQSRSEWHNPFWSVVWKGSWCESSKNIRKLGIHPRLGKLDSRGIPGIFVGYFEGLQNLNSR